MAAVDKTGTADDRLEKRYIDSWIDDRGPAYARLVDYGTPVWALVGYLRGVGGDTRQVAADYHLPLEAVEAAFAYYRRHRAQIDARILLNEA